MQMTLYVVVSNYSQLKQQKSGYSPDDMELLLTEPKNPQ